MWKPWEAFDDHPALLATHSDDGTVKVWDIHNGKQLQTFSGHPKRINSFSLHGNTLVTGHDQGEACVWEPRSGRRLHKLKGDGGEMHDAALHHGLLATSADHGAVHVWDAHLGKCLHVLQIEGQTPISVVGLHRNVLVTGFTDGTVKAWSAREGWHLQTYAARGHSINAMSVQTESIAIAAEDGPIWILDLHSGQEKCVLPKADIGAVTSISLAGPLGGVLAVGSEDGTASLWDVKCGRKVRSFSGHKFSVEAVDLRAGVLATGSADLTARTWDLGSGECLAIFKGHTGAIRSLAIANPTEP